MVFTKSLMNTRKKWVAAPNFWEHQFVLSAGVLGYLPSIMPVVLSLIKPFTQTLTLPAIPSVSILVSEWLWLTESNAMLKSWRIRKSSSANSMQLSQIHLKNLCVWYSCKRFSLSWALLVVPKQSPTALNSTFREFGVGTHTAKIRRLISGHLVFV